MLSLKSFSSPFSKLIIVYLFWLSSWIFAGSLFEVYFFGLGLSIQEIVGTSFFWSICSRGARPIFQKNPIKEIYASWNSNCISCSCIALFYQNQGNSICL